MKLIKSLSLICALCALAGISYAQKSVVIRDTAAKKKMMPVPRPKKPKPIDREISFGLRAATNGWSIFADKGYVMSEEKNSDLFYNIRLFQVEFGEAKHPKEIKRTNNIYSSSNDQSKPFIYGKENNFYALKLGYGFRRMIAGKPEPGTVSIHWVYLGGLSIGLLKPYYINVAGSPQAIKYSDSTKGMFLDKPNIIGSAGFTTGIGEIKIVPGLHAKTALHFDFANRKNMVLAVETGVNAEVYAKKLEIMANQTASNFLVNFYGSIQFGKRK